jgi:hypothetical protein
MDTQGSSMLFWKPWLDAMRFGFEVQGVVTLRFLKIAAGGAEGNAEFTKMVTEKVEAVAANHMMAPIKRRVRANHRRLKKK